MTRMRWVVATVGLILAALVLAVWVVPTVRGPWVDCGPLDQATCDRVVARLIAEWRTAWRDGHDGPPPDVPILSVVIGPGGVTESGCVWEYEISWPGGGRVVQQSCP
jgi:hypothetical protein